MMGGLEVLFCGFETDFNFIIILMEGPERGTLSAAWEDDNTIQDMIRELNFGRYAAHPRKKEEGAA